MIGLRIHSLPVKFFTPPRTILLSVTSSPLCPSGGHSDYRVECGAQHSTEERKRSPAIGASKQGAASQAGRAGGFCEEQVQGLHHCPGGQDSTAGGTAGAGGQVRILLAFTNEHYLYQTV